MKIYLIRHGATKGNLKKRYIGVTDEPLCKEGFEQLRRYKEKGGYPQTERVFVSRMRRCMQTAEFLYPGQIFITVPELSECDFGIFENKNYRELSGCPQYQEWIDSGGKLPFPGGESREGFKKRSVEGFERQIERCIKEGVSSAVFIVHGGTIMSIMETYAVPSGGYYDYQTGNGEGYELVIADAASGDSGILFGPAHRRSGMVVSSGALDRTPDYRDGKNYKKLFSQD